MHECSFSKKKTTHLFSIDHKCKKSHCDAPKKPSKESRFSKTPCCSIETSFVKSQDFTHSITKFSPSQFPVLNTMYSYVLPQVKIEQSAITPKEPEPLRYGYKYRIIMQSFLC